MSAVITIALAQVDPTVGDIAVNLALARRWRAEAAAQGADLVVYPELVLVGYPPEERVLQPALVEQAWHALEQLAADTADGGPAVVVGAPWRERDHRLHDAAFLLYGGAVASKMLKHTLPKDGVFAAGPIPGPIRLPLKDGDAVRLGVMVGEDMGLPDVAEGLGECGAEILLVLDGSAYGRGKPDQRLQHAVARVTETGLPLVYVNQVGGQGALVCDGGSFALDAGRRLVTQVPMFAEGLGLTRWRRDAGDVWSPVERGPVALPVVEPEAAYRAMVLGLRDHVAKNRFPSVVLGLTGDIDSALSAAVAVDALGAERVRAVTMPSRHASHAHLEDAAAVAQRLGIRVDEIALEPAVAALQQMLAPVLDDRGPDIAEENLEARIRSAILMAISDRLRLLVLATGREPALAGGYPVLRNADETALLDLARWRNANRPEGSLGASGEVIPMRVIAQPPLPGDAKA